MSKSEVMAFARSIQHPEKHFIHEPWRGMFKSLGRTNEFQSIQTRYAQSTHFAARELCQEYSLWSERALALMFDIKVQNGSISDQVKAQILADFGRLPSTLTREDLEIQKMIIIANRRADAANPRWIEDVRARKLCCAKGSGFVHGIEFNLEEQFGLKLVAL